MRCSIRMELETVGRHSRVWLDDREISTSVRGIKVETTVDGSSIVTLTLLPAKVDVKGEADVFVQRVAQIVGAR